MGLASSFLPHLPEGVPALGDGAALEGALADLVGRARAAWPDIAVSDEVLMRHAAERVSPGEDVLAWVKALRASDLYLACACALGDARALAAFEARFMVEVPAYLGRRGNSRAFIDEVQQAVRARVLVAEAGGPPRIAGYTGRGPLAGWLRMAALRVAVNLRAADPSRREIGVDEIPAPAGAGPDPELALLKGRYGGEFRAALQTTLSSLPVREANVLRLHFLDGLTLDKIAGLYHVNERTVRRWISATRQTILLETRRRLIESAALTSSQLTGLIDLLRADVDVTLVRFLRHDDPEGG